jgi:hypothetical protein
MANGQFGILFYSYYNDPKLLLLKDGLIAAPQKTGK